MIPTLALVLVVATTLEVEAPSGCVDRVELEVVLQDVGGLDPAEQVEVRVTPRLDEYALTVDVALLNAPALHREVPLRPAECRDVADLVAVLVQQQRRAALETRLLGRDTPATTTAPTTTPTTTTPPTTAPTKSAAAPSPLPDPAPTPPRHPLDDAWSPCEGPARCGGWRASLGLGGALGLGDRVAIDAGWDLGSATILAQGSAIGTGAEADDERRGDIAVGAAWRSMILDHLELSARGLVGIGGTSGGNRPSTNSAGPCVLDDNGDPVSAAPGKHVVEPTWYVGPSVAVRARFGYVFVEAGSFWHLRVDATPVTYVHLGLAPLGS